MMDYTATNSGIDPSNYWETLLLTNTGFNTNKNSYYQERVIWTTDLKPDWSEGGTDYMVVNIPTFLQMTELDMDEVPWRFLLINVKDPDDHDLID